MSLEGKLRGIRQILGFDNRLHLLMQRLLFRNDRLGVYRMGPLEFVVDHAAGDASGAPDVLTRPMYLDYLTHLRTPHPATVLDIGANAGGFPMFLVKHGIPLARVVAVELNPRTCVRLRFNLERNVHADIEVVNAGLCGRARTLELALGDGSVADSLYSPSFNASAVTTVVAGRTFDDLCVSAFGEQPVDICKIDVEQAEYEVVDHPGHDRLRQCRIVVMEIHDVPGRHHGHVTGAVERLGFRRLAQQSDRSVYVFVNEAAEGQRVGTA